MTPPPRLKVRLEGADLCWRLPLCRLELRRALAHMVEAARRADAGVAADAALELVLARDEDVAELNSLHMGCAGPTNVLSFPNGPPDRPRSRRGDGQPVPPHACRSDGGGLTTLR